MSVYQDMLDFFEVSRPARKYIVPCAIGPAGIGKTAAVEEHARKCESKLVTIIASQILPNEVSGITMPVAETKAMEIYDHYRLSQLRDGDILFFDELLEADQLVLSACLTLIESRMLMSGRKLPDIQIIAATNPTIKPNMLKENIRQRFVFKKFDIDPDGTAEYIKERYGFNVGGKLLSMLRTSGDEYNIMTPRSLTKMAAWMAESNGDAEKAGAIAQQINSIWGSMVGTELKSRYMDRVLDPKFQVRDTVVSVLKDNGIEVSDHVARTLYNDDIFEETSVEDLMNMLTELDEWDLVEQSLRNSLIEEDSKEVDF